MKLPICIYGVDLQQDLRRMYDEVRKLTERQIDGDNVSDVLLGDGLEFSVPVNKQTTPRRVINSLGNTSGNSWIAPKGDGLSPETNYGMEIFVDASSASYGRVCVGDKDYTSQQLISLIPEDPASVAAPGGTIQTTYGTMIFEGFAGDEFVFNESSIDVNFRVESNGNPNLIFGDGGTDRVGIGNASPQHLFHVGSGTEASGLSYTDVVYVCGATTAGLITRETGSNVVGEFVSTSSLLRCGTFSNHEVILIANNASHFQLTSTITQVNNFDIVPETTNARDLGTSSKGFKEIYIRTIDTDGANDLTIQRNNVTQITLGGTNITSNDKHIVATTTNTADLGTSSVAWREVFTRSIDTDGAQALAIQQNNTTRITLGSDGSTTMGESGGAICFYGGTAQTKQTVSGSRGGNAALASVLTALANLGLITDSSTA